jgi:hypothetical protein
MASELDAAARRALLPSSAIPLAYFASAHAGLAAALLVLVVRPDVPAGFFFHQRMVALVHLVTLAWLSGSILGAFYIVAPLALRLPMPAGRGDWIAFASFASGVLGMIGHFWIGSYDGMAWAAGLVVAAIAWVATRAFRGLSGSTAPWGVKLHVVLAFANILLAAGFGILMGLDRTRSFLGITPLVSAYAHAHLAAIGWVTMMAVGLSYRLIPMFVPAAMPSGRGLALSAILIELGLAVLFTAIVTRSPWLPAGAVLITAGLGSFVRQIRAAVRHKMPRPPALPARDWSTWQTHTALLWLLIATGLGLWLALGVPGRFSIQVMWIYGVAGLVGFLTQIVVGMQGRLVPLYAWYRAFAANGGAPPPRGANELPSAAFAKAIFLLWTPAVPALTAGLAFAVEPLIAGSAACLLAGVGASAAYLVYLLRAPWQTAAGKGSTP